MDDPAPAPAPHRALFIAIGLVAVGVGALGAVLPLLPTTPFLLIALWAFSKSSQRLHDWLYNHRIFGPQLKNWREHRVVTPVVRYTAYASMLGSLYITAFLRDLHWSIPAAVAVLSIIGIYYISRCPSSAPEPDANDTAS